jgi:hypothetical protein
MQDDLQNKFKEKTYVGTNAGSLSSVTPGFIDMGKVVQYS